MINVHKVSKRFGRQQVLADVDLSIGEGERVALIGHNGSGKTTLLRCLLGLYRCDGDLTVFGLDPRNDRQRMLSHVGFVPQQSPGLRATVSQYLFATTRLCALKKEAIEEVALLLGLPIADIEHKPFHALSGGMKQKLLIAVALARKPRLLIMDEPAANLDPVARAAFFKELDKLGPTTTLLLSSHRIDEISGLVTRLVELDSGQIVLDDVVSVDSAVGGVFNCGLTLHQGASDSVDATLREWGLEPFDGRRSWRGPIAAADRFRFMCLIARWSGMVQGISLKEDSDHAQ